MILDKTRSRHAIARRVLLLALIPSVAVLVVLAVLRPTAKAQEMPTPPGILGAANLGAANSSVPLTLAGITLGKQSGNNWNDQTDGVWWNQAGMPLAKPVYDTHTPSYRMFEMSLSERDKMVIFAFHAPASLKGASFDYETAGGHGISANSRWPVSGLGGGPVIAVSFPVGLTKTTLRVGVAFGPWTVAETGQGGFSSTSGSGRTVIFSPVAETAQGLVMTVTTEGIKGDLRIVAIDKAGHTILPGSVGGSGSGGSVTQLTRSFALPRKQLKEFRVETRPFQWIEFKDVALKPIK